MPSPSDADLAESELIVWRKEFEVFHAAIGPEEARAFERAQRGETLDEICAEFSGMPSPVETAFSALSSWFDEGMVARVGPASARAEK